ncbi:MAG: methylenetetrahydrofolate reductase C-terminal domain-containing protein [Syntrophorhabdaceae bacterium]|nr:methylenetetrahydrofolate reductase C-terminal domain-containing protein [Syntrophorhabdaceae bacterium]
MVVAEQKPLKDILSYIDDSKRIIIAGCHGCVTVCSTGGQKEVDILASLIEIAGKKQGKEYEIKKITLQRQCDPEFLEELIEMAKDYDAIISMACGAGVQLVAERVGPIKVFPALNTTFIGVVETKGEWAERCQACGDCKLYLTGGICPVTRCSKSLLNGPCGGSHEGFCEVDPKTPCGWQLIVDRLKAIGCLHTYATIVEPADWSKSRDGGPRRMIREDLK